jgi:cobalt-zinc-cadmium efflux system outer membrane protein
MNWRPEEADILSLLMRRVSFFLLIWSVTVFAQTNPPITLDQAIQEALDHNLDLLAAKYDVPVAETRLITARLRPNPVATVSGDHLDVLGTGFNEANSAGPNEFAYRTDFVLERGSKRQARIAVAEQDRAVARLNVASAVRTVVLGVQNAFLDVQLAKENLQLAEQNQKALQGIVDVNGIRVRSGDLAAVELSRSQVALLQFEAAVQQARLRLQDARNRLQLLLGRMNPAADFEVTGDFRRDKIADTPETLVQNALERRPEIAALRASEARTIADLRLQLAQGRVDYTIGSEYRRQQGINGTGNTLGIFFSAPIPVFNRNQGEIERARRESEQAAARIRALEASIRSDVASAWQHYQTTQSLLTNVETHMLEQARDVRKTTEYSYRRGEASLVEFLDAQRAFNDSMQTWNEARADYARSLYLLESLAGMDVTEGVKK